MLHLATLLAVFSAEHSIQTPLTASNKAGCATHFTCCAQWDFFIPVMKTCVENEPPAGTLVRTLARTLARSAHT